MIIKGSKKKLPFFVEITKKIGDWGVGCGMPIQIYLYFFKSTLSFKIEDIEISITRFSFFFLLSCF